MFMQLCILQNYENYEYICLLVYTGSRSEGGQAEKSRECNRLNHSSILVEPEMEGMALYMEASEEKRKKHI